MNRLTQRSLAVGVLAAGLVLASGATANADSGRSAKSADLTSIGNVGVLNGNQIYMPIQIPINVCGNAIGVLGNAVAWCEGGASATIW